MSETMAIHELLSALAFTLPPPASRKNVDHQFFSPHKKSNDKNNALQTPARTLRVQFTPPTDHIMDLDEEEDDDDDLENSSGVMSPSPDQHRRQVEAFTQHLQQVEQASTTSPSPVRNLQVRPSGAWSVDSSVAVHAAYPLSLPLEVTTISSSDSSNSSSSEITASSQPKKKACKKFPMVQTDVTGISVQRSSTSQNKWKRGPLFVPMITTEQTVEYDAQGRPQFKRRSVIVQVNNSSEGVAHHIYGNAKGAWAFGKGVFVLGTVLELAEQVASTVAGITTGKNDLREMDGHVVTPLVLALDEHVFNPVLSFLLGGGKNNDDKETKHP